MKVPPGFGSRSHSRDQAARFARSRWRPAAAAGAGCSAGLAELSRELCGCEDRQVVAQDEQVFVAGDQIRTAVDRECEEVVVVGVSGADRRWACWILGDGSVITDPVDEGGRFLRSDPRHTFWYLQAAPELMAIAGQRLEAAQ